MKLRNLVALALILISLSSPTFAKRKGDRQRISALSVSSTFSSDELFAYDRSRPFEVKEVSRKEQDGVSIQDIEYAPYSSKRDRLKAFIIRPTERGSFAAVLFFHWLGRPRGDRTQFLEEAVALAKQGTISLLIQGHFPWQVDPSDGPTDRQLIIDETIEVRRALDLLASQPMVDRKRLGYVGHDYGAMYGSLLASVEKRLKTYVLIAGIGSFTDWSLGYWLKTKPDDFKKSYAAAMEGLEPISIINHASPASLFFQFAKTDKYISKDHAEAFYNSAGQPKQIKWYDATHDMDVEAARSDRREWLTEKLSLNKVRVARR